MSEQPSDTERLKLLYDYTKFHIGLYAGIVAATLGISKLAESSIVILWPFCVLSVGVLCMVLAGMCGAVVASTIPDVICTKTYDAFMESTIKKAKAKNWVTWEHRIFWIGVILLLIGSLATAWPG